MTSSNLHQVLLEAAGCYCKHGWVPHPLGLDSSGFPKRPLSRDWPHLTSDPDTVGSLPWDQARGLGLVLGPASGNLAVIDVDDAKLGVEIVGLFTGSGVQTRLVETVRKRLHVYVREAMPSRSTALKILYMGREVGIELKAQGTQVAAPPTPGYAVLMDHDPIQVPSIAEAWRSIALRLPTTAVTGSSERSAGYPRPWQPYVPEGERNRALYVEACRLRDACMPFDEAFEIMTLRVATGYAGSLEIGEIEGTVRSAYKKPKNGEAMMHSR